MLSILLPLVAGFSASVSAQSNMVYTWQNTADYPYYLNSTELHQQSMDNLTMWCTQQTNVCFGICGGAANSSCTVNPTTYVPEWVCGCTAYQTPNITQFVQTVPWNECLVTQSLCLAATTQDATANKACIGHCGNRTAAEFASSASASAAAAATSSAGASGSSTGPASAPATGTASPTSSHNAAATAMIENTFVRSGALLAGLAGAAGMML